MHYAQPETILARQLTFSGKILANERCNWMRPSHSFYPNHVGLPFFDIDTPKKEQEKKAKADEKLHQFIDAIIHRKPASDLVIGRWPRINSRFLGGFFTRYLITDKPFHVDSVRCVKCGICADVCPTRNVVGGLGQEPTWKHNGSCLACFACYHHCPHHAIEYGRQTQHKGQYFFKRRRR